MLSLEQRRALIARLRKVASEEQPDIAVEFERIAARLERGEDPSSDPPRDDDAE
jgi:hypothetical protein